jgi:DNA-binding MarR family transcriptional regulator
MSTPAKRIHELLMELVRASGLLVPEQGVHGHPVSLSQMFALHELDGGTPLSQRELAERLQLDKSSVSRMAAELARKGLLVRERDPQNHRQYRLRLTERGHAVHVQTAARYNARYEHWVTAMTPAERAALLKGLPALVRAIREHG